MAKIFVEVSGGVVDIVHNVPADQEWEVIDWDNLLNFHVYIEGDAARAWGQLSPEAQQFVQGRYPTEYKQIQDRIAGDRKDEVA